MLCSSVGRGFKWLLISLLIALKQTNRIKKKDLCFSNACANVSDLVCGWENECTHREGSFIFSLKFLVTMTDKLNGILHLSSTYAIHRDLQFFVLTVAEPPVPLLRPWWMDFIVVVTVGCTSAFFLLLILLICYKAIKRYSLHSLVLFMKCVCRCIEYSCVWENISHLSFMVTNCY